MAVETTTIRRQPAAGQRALHCLGISHMFFLGVSSMPRSIRSVTVAFQGVEGAYSQLAAGHLFKGYQPQWMPRPDFAGVYRAVVAGRAQFGIVPVENSLTGSIHANYDLMLAHKVVIVGETKQRISHSCLAMPRATLGGLREVYSHPQALAQCAGFLRKMPHVKVVPEFDTAGAAAFVAASGRLDCAAIASRVAGLRYGLKALATEIEDHEQNFTRFLALAKKEPAKALPGRRRKTSVVFALKSVPGALYKSLSVFALRDLDLVKIESRPIAGKPWDYMFYLDFVAAGRAGEGQRALAHLAEITEFLRDLGTYPCA